MLDSISNMLLSPISQITTQIVGFTANYLLIVIWVIIIPTNKRR